MTVARVELRQQTISFTLLSAKEVQPGVTGVAGFRGRTPAATKVPRHAPGSSDSGPRMIASFSLRAASASPQ